MGETNAPKKNVIYGTLFAIVALLGSLLLAFATKRDSSERTIPFTELAPLAATRTARAVTVSGERVVVEARGERLVAIVSDALSRHDALERFAEAGAQVVFEPTESPAAREAKIALPIALVTLLGAGFFLLRRRSTSTFTSFRRGSGPSVRFSDVAGMDEAKESLAETIEFLANPARFGRLGGRAPKGVLLTGAPGTGKTLLARAVANEAGVPFLSASGSSFQEMYVGIGAARVRTLFAEAKRLAPCIVFLDEIDAVGRARARSGDPATLDHDQTLNQLLVEMDGFDGTTGVVVMASTNRPEVLDAAILRAGRFDRQVVVPLPDLRGRLEILGVHARPIELEENVDLANLARQTPGFSGAELANVLNEAAILAAREGAAAVGDEHLEKAKDQVLLGAERRGFAMDPGERYATAVHEAGHVAVGLSAEHTDPVHKVSILPRGRSLGVTQSLPERDRHLCDNAYLEDQICMLLGGRAAEIEVLGTMTAGAADDLERATRIAWKMVAELGMSTLGPIALRGTEPRSQGFLDQIEAATQGILTRELERARKMVRVHDAAIRRLVEELVEKDTLEAAEIRACFSPSGREH